MERVLLEGTDGDAADAGTRLPLRQGPWVLLKVRVSVYLTSSKAFFRVSKVEDNGENGKFVREKIKKLETEWKKS